jgi:alpha-amylase
MIPICLYFQVHQPYRLRRYNYFDVGREHRYFDEAGNAELLRRAARKCYRPATEMLARLLDRHPGFAVAFSLSGCLLEQLGEWDRDTLAALRNMLEKSGGRVEILAETSHHSLAWLASRDEFAAQVDAHRAPRQRSGSLRLRVFHNTRLIFSDARGWLEERGFMSARRRRALLYARSPHHLYHAATPAGLPLCPGRARLSDDIAFASRSLELGEWPLTAEKYDRWVSGLSGGSCRCSWTSRPSASTSGGRPASSILEGGLGRTSARGGVFWTPSQAVANLTRRETLSAPLRSPGRTGRGTSRSGRQRRQKDALRRLSPLQARVRDSSSGASGAPGSEDLRRDFRRLSPSDHFYYMATASSGSHGQGASSGSHGQGMTSADAEVHAYFSPYESPYEAYIAYVHVLSDLERRLPRRGRTAAEATGSRRPAAPMPA